MCSIGLLMDCICWTVFNIISHVCLLHLACCEMSHKGEVFCKGNTIETICHLHITETLHGICLPACHFHNSSVEVVQQSTDQNSSLDQSTDQNSSGSEHWPEFQWVRALTRIPVSQSTDQNFSESEHWPEFQWVRALTRISVGRSTDQNFSGSEHWLEFQCGSEHWPELPVDPSTNVNFSADQSTDGHFSVDHSTDQCRTEH